MKVRRVTTGQTQEGKSVVAEDCEVEGIITDLIPGYEFHRLWGQDQVPALPTDGTLPDPGAYFPGPTGFRFGLFTIPPRRHVELGDDQRQRALAEFETQLPGLLGHFEHGTAMHTTDTVDFEYVVSGEVWLELDDGQEVHLKPGDTVIQNGTRHAWRNRGSVPCQMVVCLIGARRGGTDEPAE